MKRIAIVGSGNFGANAALAIAENNLAHVTLIDNKEGLARGKALDLMEAAPVLNFAVRVEGADSLEAIAGADVVIHAAGAARKAGTAAQDLLPENQQVLTQIVEAIKARAPEAILVIQREPVAALVSMAVGELGLKPERVIGITGLAEAARLRYFIARALDISPLDTTAMVVGGQGQAMIPLTQYANVSGIPIGELMTDTAINQVIRQAQQTEDELLGQLKLMPPFYTPAAAVAELIQAITMDLKRILPVTVVAQGEYGQRDKALTLPAMIGERGIERIVEVPLEDWQSSALAAV